MADKTQLSLGASFLYDGGGTSNALQTDATGATVVASGADVIHVGAAKVLEVNLYSETADDTGTLLVSEFAATPAVNKCTRVQEVPVDADLASTVDRAMFGLTTGTEKSPKRAHFIPVRPGSRVMLNMASVGTGPYYARFALHKDMLSATGGETGDIEDLLALLGKGTGAMATSHSVTVATDDTVLGPTDAAVVAAGAVGSLSAKMRRLTTDIGTLLKYIHPPVQTPLVTLAMTGTLANDKITLPSNCVKVIFKLSIAAYVNPADSTPTTVTGVQFPPNIALGMDVTGAAYLYAEAASGTMQAIAFCTA